MNHFQFPVRNFPFMLQFLWVFLILLGSWLLGQG